MFTLQNLKDSNYGWIPPHKRTNEQKKLDAALKLAMPKFKILGNGMWKANQKVVCWDATLVLRNGKHLECFHQDTGSCTGQGATKTQWYVEYVDKAVKGEREQPRLLYEPYTYAQGRVCAGISGGEAGGTGAGTAEAVRTYGGLDATISGLPEFETRGETIYWPASTDDGWGRRGAPQEYIKEGKNHLIKTTSLINNTDEAIEALSNYYPMTCASNWGGQMSPPVKGTKFPVLLNTHADSWNHQMCCIATWDHPELGRIFYIQNSWGEDAHGTPPDGAPPGGFWISARDFQYIIDQQEVFAYSQFDGFPEQRLDPSLFKVL